MFTIEGLGVELPRLTEYPSQNKVFILSYLILYPSTPRNDSTVNTRMLCI